MMTALLLAGFFVSVIAVALTEVHRAPSRLHRGAWTVWATMSAVGLATIVARAA